MEDVEADRGNNDDCCDQNVDEDNVINCESLGNSFSSISSNSGMMMLTSRHVPIDIAINKSDKPIHLFCF